MNRVTIIVMTVLLALTFVFSLDQVCAGISVTTEDGETLGAPAPAETFQEPGVPSEVVLNGASGHVLVPMFELHDASPPGTSVEHQVRCYQQGQPVIETTFRLHFVTNQANETDPDQTRILPGRDHYRGWPVQSFILSSL